jgi:prolyl-tRNA synthetase
MKYSQLVGRTLRDAPAGTDTASAALLIRAGFIRQLGAGIYTMLPLGLRSSSKIKAILREEMDAIGCHELLMPFTQPADLWNETGRTQLVGDELVRFKDRAGRDMVLAATHEEVATDLIRREVRSYRQLPVLFFQLQTKFRDEVRPRAGLLRAREFLMKDAYSFHATEDDFNRVYEDFHQAYLRIFERSEIPVRVVESGAGYMGGWGSHEFILEAGVGEDVLLVCPEGDYSANREVAITTFEIPVEGALQVEEVATPDSKTIAAVAGYLGVNTNRTVKAVFYNADGEFVFVVIRGDRDVNEIKLQAVLGSNTLRPATDEEIRASGAVPGYASPVGLTGITVVADLSAQSPNLVAGANREGFHLKHVNLGRDFQATHVADIAVVYAGDPCPVCGTSLEERRGIEVGNIFKLGYKYSASLNASFQDENGNEQLMIMGSYGIGVGRLLAAVAEHHHDDKGLVWPESISPFDVHVVGLGASDEVQAAVDALEAGLKRAGKDALFDDREDSAGVKFNDADLIGIPWRVTVSPRSLKAGGYEVKHRRGESSSARTVALDDLLAILTGGS